MSFPIDFDSYPVVNVIKSFSQHTSTLKIKKIKSSSSFFSFQQVKKGNILYQIKLLDPSKATQKYDISTIYHWLSILSNVSKIYERPLYHQLKTYFEFLLYKHQHELRKVVTVLNTLLAVIEN